MGYNWQFAGWYYKQNGQRFGPLSTGEVRQLLDAGRLHSVDRVWQQWVRGQDRKLAATTAQTALRADAAL